MSSTVRLAVLFGGRSSEHGVSCRSAAGVIGNLQPGRYMVVPIRITTDGRWIVGAELVPGAIDEAGLVGATPEPAGELPVIDSIARAVAVLRDVDVALPCLHGRYGEDGTVQGVLTLAEVPFVGSGVLASATAMDKAFTKTILAAEGIPVADGVVLDEGDELTPAQRERIGLPAFVKPARGGSSIGVSRIQEWGALSSAVAVARGFDPKVLVEASIPGREVDVGVLEMPDGRLVAGPPLEIRYTSRAGFFDYDAKYHTALTEFVVPAELDEATTRLLGEEAIRVFRTLGCAGLLRVDFFLPPDGPPVVNEVNTMPGMTPRSQFPRMWRAAGITYEALLDLLVAGPMARSGKTASVVLGRQP